MFLENINRQVSPGRRKKLEATLLSAFLKLFCRGPGIFKLSKGTYPESDWKLNLNIGNIIKATEEEEKLSKHKDKLCEWEAMEKLASLSHLYVTLFLGSFAAVVVLPAITDVTMSALCPGRDECSLAIYLSGFQQAVRSEKFALILWFLIFLFLPLPLSFLFVCLLLGSRLCFTGSSP